jgi:copper chaperone
MSAIKLTIDGMTCEHCRKTVEDALMNVSGVWGVEVDLQERSADVQCDVVRVKLDELIAAVKAAGYEAEVAA